MLDVDTFDALADEFRRRTGRIVYCAVATVDTTGAPRTRILHPIWEGPIGWIFTGRHGPKARHLERESRIALSYWDPDHDVVSIQANASWIDDPMTRQRIWDLFRSTPTPVGYDPAVFWPGGPTDPTVGLLRADPWLVELTALAAMPGPRLRWRSRTTAPSTRTSGRPR